MIGIVIVAHGALAREYLSVLEHVVGPLQGVCAIGIDSIYDRAAKESEICAAADAVDTGKGVVIVTDLFGGSPSNLSLRACSQENRQIIYGTNLPVLIKLVRSRHKPVATAVRASLSAGKKYIDSHNAMPGSH